MSAQLTAKNHIHEMKNKLTYLVSSDYLYALELCYDTNAPYIMIFEDDIIIADSWFIKTKQAISQIESKAIRGGKAAYNYLYMRIFYTETAMRWRNSDFWFRRMDLLIALSASFTCLFLLGFRRGVPSSRRYLDTWTLCVLCLVAVPAFIILLFMIGKYSLFPPKGVFVMNRYGCCTQALIFPRDRVPPMVKWFRDWSTVLNRAYISTDVMIDYYADEQGMDRLALGPQLLQHVGLTSSRDGRYIDGRSTRSFWFDEYDPVKLRKEHDAILKTFQS